MAILPQSTRIVSPSSIVTVTELFPHTVPRSLASSDANEVLTDISNAERLVDPLLRIGAQSNDIYPVVEVDLSSPHDEEQQHQEDQQNSTRRRSSNNSKKSPAATTKRRISDPTQEQKQELATEAAMKLHLSLISNFNGNDEQSKYILLARINMVSDGCCGCNDDCKDYSPDTNSSKNNKSSARRLLLPFWSSKKAKKSKKKKSDDSRDYLDTNDDNNNNAAVGGAKLEISYCLFVRDSGKVAFVENKSYTKYPRNNQNQQIGNSSNSSGGKGGKSKANYDNSNSIIEGKQLVMELTNRCAHEIQKEIMSSSQQHPVPRRMPSIVPPPLSS